MIILREPFSFEWDKGNKGKNFAKHQVADQECEEVFFDQHKRILKDIIHSQREDRYVLLGQTRAKRKLFIVFTMRREKIRVISARILNKREEGLYE